jgi:hypothetical protein
VTASLSNAIFATVSSPLPCCCPSLPPLITVTLLLPPQTARKKCEKIYVVVFLLLNLYICNGCLQRYNFFPSTSKQGRSPPYGAGISRGTILRYHTTSKHGLRENLRLKTPLSYPSKKTVHSILKKMQQRSILDYSNIASHWDDSFLTYFTYYHSPNNCRQEVTKG